LVGVLPGCGCRVPGGFVIPSDQISFTDAEYANRRRVSRREQFLESMDATIPWSRWVELIEPFTYSGGRGGKPKAPETML
jgi:IS5 family transposase